LVCLGATAAPRLLWWQSHSTDSWRFFVALGLYWNVVFLTCFASPLLVVVGCWFSPRFFLPLMLLYGLWVRAISRPDLGSGQSWRWFAECEWGYHAFRRFLQFKLHIPEALRVRPKEQTVLFAVHPHGVASDFRILMDGIMYEAFPDRDVLALVSNVLFKLPLVREMALWTRSIDARKAVALRAFEKGHSVMVLPGGTMEQIRTKFGHEEVHLRPGFVRLALEAGAALVPCYVFGCVDLYKTSSALFWLREKIRKHVGACIPLYSGSVGVLPRRVPLDVVFGEPLELPACAEPGKATEEEVAAALQLYIEALERLFDAHKERFGYGDRKLAIQTQHAPRDELRQVDEECPLKTELVRVSV